MRIYIKDTTERECKVEIEFKKDSGEGETGKYFVVNEVKNRFKRVVIPHNLAFLTNPAGLVGGLRKIQISSHFPYFFLSFRPHHPLAVVHITSHHIVVAKSYSFHLHLPTS